MLNKLLEKIIVKWVNNGEKLDMVYIPAMRAMQQVDHDYGKCTM